MPPQSLPDHLSDAVAPGPLPWQPSLVGVEPPAYDRCFASLTRVELDNSSWVDHAPGWLAGSDQLFDELLATVPWRRRSRLMYGRTVDEPRLTHWLAAGDRPWPVLISEAGRLLSARYQVEFDSAGLNLYRDGRDSVAWHRDRIPAEITDPVVALLSLGHPRRLLLRPRGGGPSRSFAAGARGPPGDGRAHPAALGAHRPQGGVRRPEDKPGVPPRRAPLRRKAAGRSRSGPMTTDPGPAQTAVGAGPPRSPLRVPLAASVVGLRSISAMPPRAPRTAVASVGMKILLAFPLAIAFSESR